MTDMASQRVPSSEPYTNEAQQSFLDRLTRLSSADRDMLAVNLDRRLHDAGVDCYLLITRFTRGAEGWTYGARDAYFLVATVAAVVRASDKPADTFGAALGRLQRATGGSYGPIVQDLLRAHRDDINRMVGGFAREIAQRNIKVHLPTLLRDILAWNADDRQVQRRWADAFIRTAS
jgi:CRISPR type I-E-associated protein CasB/Cse2